jgi:hypothetical protein
MSEEDTMKFIKKMLLFLLIFFASSQVFAVVSIKPYDELLLDYPLAEREYDNKEMNVNFYVDYIGPVLVAGLKYEGEKISETEADGVINLLTANSWDAGTEFTTGIFALYIEGSTDGDAPDFIATITATPFKLVINGNETSNSDDEIGLPLVVITTNKDDALNVSTIVDPLTGNTVTTVRMTLVDNSVYSDTTGLTQTSTNSNGSVYSFQYKNVVDQSPNAVPLPFGTYNSLVTIEMSVD